MEGLRSFVLALGRSRAILPPDRQRRDCQHRQHHRRSDARHVQEGQGGGKLIPQRLIGPGAGGEGRGGKRLHGRQRHDPADDLHRQRDQPQDARDLQVGPVQQTALPAPPHRSGPQQAVDRRQQHQQHIPPQHIRQIVDDAVTICIVLR